MIKLISALTLTTFLSGCINLGDMPPLPEPGTARQAVSEEVKPVCYPVIAIPRMPKDMRISVTKGMISADEPGEAYLRKIFDARKTFSKACGEPS